jgi:DNA-binding transcriptional LysR family regulator
VAPLYYDRVLSACHAAGLTLNIAQEGNSDTTMLSLVAGGIGLSFTIKSAERRKPDSVVLKEVEDLRLTVNLSAIWREDNKIPALRKLIEIVRETTAAQSFANGAEPYDDRILPKEVSGVQRPRPALLNHK